jgi:ketosteroid isomerase-like protein
MLAWTAPGIQSMDEAYAWMAKAAIAELITRYAALNDAGDWDGVAALYTEDGRMSRPTAPDEFIDGRAAILAAATPPWVGTYQDRLIRTEDGWRFVERRASLDFRAA